MKKRNFTNTIKIILTLAVLMACQNTVQVDENMTAFTLSDTMLERVEFHQVQLEVVKNQLRLFGKITAENSKLAQVYPIVGGVVTSIPVELGDYVKQGQVMATIRSSEVAEFEKQKLDANNNVAMAEKNLQVARDLYSGKLASEKDVTAAERELDKARAEQIRINEVFSIYKLQPGSIYMVTAPISGFIISKKINQNEQLRADNAEPLFSIAEINTVWALANVNESDIAKIEVGFDAEVETLSFPDQRYTGKIDRIFNAIDPDTKSMKVRVSLPNEDLRLKPEMHCTVTVKYKENKRLVVIPSSAIIFDKSKHWVMVYKDRNNIETRRVDVYRNLGNSTYINAGLEEGETVISNNGLLIYDALND
jgi:membrane fusion protein, heavy metal efflux system